MKLLLTSNGLSNESIANALFDLVGKKPEETIIAFIPTAMNVEEGEKNWFVNDLQNIINHHVKELDIVDISALPKDIWEQRLERADVLFFSGGNSFHLMHWIIKSGLRDQLNALLETRVWAGISAGSMVTNPTLFFSSSDKKTYYEKLFGYDISEALNYVDFYTRPHLNSPHFPHASEESIKAKSKDTQTPVYALDDYSAVKVDGDKAEVISEGVWKKYN
jgi:dipeptidase E